MRFNFVLGNAFPSDNILSKWIVGFSIILNDLILANNYMIQEFEKISNKPSAEGSYFFRLTCSHFREAIKYINDTITYQEVIDFLNKMDPETKNNLTKLKTLYEPWENSFLKDKIKPIRDKSFHYPSLKEDEVKLTNILEELKNKTTGIYSTRILKDLRLEFGDEVVNAYCFDHFIDEEDFKNTVITLREAVTWMLSFAQGVVAIYLGNLPQNVVVKEE